MGTRSVLAAYVDGEYKLAQYGHTGSEPSDQGVAILTFLQNRNIESFKSKLRQVMLVSSDHSGSNRVENRRLFEPSRGCEALDWIQVSPEPIAFIDYLAFAGASLLCEWVYVIDFDTGTFEVFEGYNREQTPDGSRFPSSAKGDWLSANNGYEPVVLVKAYDLASLPEIDEFLADMKELCRSPNAVRSYGLRR